MAVKTLQLASSTGDPLRRTPAICAAAMPTGFIYVVTTVTRSYSQWPGSVPTAHAGRLYFGPCKRAMRQKMEVGDYVFGISPAHTAPRRIVFFGKIQKRMK